MADDPYKVLGVARDASDEDIRRAYRKLAKELHPDLNPANRATAEERFKKVSAAYDIVGDPEKRGSTTAARSMPTASRGAPIQRAHAGGGPFGGRAGGGRARTSASATSSPTCSGAGAAAARRAARSARAGATCATRWRSISWSPPPAPRSA